MALGLRIKPFRPTPNRRAINWKVSSLVREEVEHDDEIGKENGRETKGLLRGAVDKCGEVKVIPNLEAI